MVSDWVLSSEIYAGRQSRGERRSPRGAVRRRPLREGGSRPARIAAGWGALRAALFLVAIGLLFSGLSFVRTYASGETPAAPKAGERVVYADDGDSLWKIAVSVKREGVDTRAAVHAIMKRNGLAGTDLRIGQKLIIPAHILPSAADGGVSS
jgi:hypothetical protein